MWELDNKKGWAPKKWCLQTVVLEKTLESPLDCKEIKPVNPKGNQSWIFTGRTDAEAEAPIFWPPDVKSRLIGKDPDAGKTEGRRRRGRLRTRWFDGITDSMDMSLSKLWDGDGQGSLAWCSPWGRKESDTTKWLNNRWIYKILCYLFILSLLSLSFPDIKWRCLKAWWQFHSFLCELIFLPRWLISDVFSSKI